MLFARAVGPGGRVIAFEPDPAKIDRVRHNVRINGFTHVECVPYAIGGDAPSLEFRIQPSTTSHVVGAYVGAEPQPLPESARVIQVSALSLDTALQRFPAPQLVKLDIEGGELVALRHADRLLGGTRSIIALELHNPEADTLAWEVAQRFRYDILTSHDERITDRRRVGGHVLLRPRE